MFLYEKTSIRWPWGVWAETWEHQSFQQLWVILPRAAVPWCHCHQQLTLKAQRVLSKPLWPFEAQPLSYQWLLMERKEVPGVERYSLGCTCNPNVTELLAVLKSARGGGEVRASCPGSAHSGPSDHLSRGCSRAHPVHELQSWSHPHLEQRETAKPKVCQVLSCPCYHPVPFDPLPPCGPNSHLSLCRLFLLWWKTDGRVRYALKKTSQHTKSWFSKNRQTTEHRAVCFLRAPNWLHWPVFSPKPALLITCLLFCLGFHLASCLKVSLVLLSLVFDEWLKRMLILTTVFTLCSSMCRCFHFSCSHPTNATSLFIQSKWQQVTLGSAQREGHAWFKCARREAPTASHPEGAPKQMLWLIPSQRRWIIWK